MRHYYYEVGQYKRLLLLLQCIKLFKKVNLNDTLKQELILGKATVRTINIFLITHIARSFTTHIWRRHKYKLYLKNTFPSHSMLTWVKKTLYPTYRNCSNSQSITAAINLHITQWKLTSSGNPSRQIQVENTNSMTTKIMWQIQKPNINYKKINE